MTPDTETGGFLAGVTLRRVALPEGAAFQPAGLALGNGASALEVLVASTLARPNPTTLRSAWKARNE